MNDVNPDYVVMGTPSYNIRLIERAVELVHPAGA
jgi:hypothetical protein